MKSVGLWLLLLVLAAGAGYCAGNRRARAVTRPQLVAADSAVRDAKLHIAGLERSNHRLADSLDASDSAIARHRLEANRSADRARRAEIDAATLRAGRSITPAGSGARDSVTFYRAQLAAADREAELLAVALEERRRELATRDSIDQLQREQIKLLLAAKDSAIAQLRRVVPALEAARTTIAASEPRCRLPLGLPCPSRKAVALGTTVVVLSAVVAIDRAAKPDPAPSDPTRRVLP